MTEKKASFHFFRQLLRFWKNIRDRFAESLGVTEERKASIYIDLARSATLKDIVYWLQIFFSAGIATLGLVLSSPAVIIGAMLISPLMGPILSGGLALATGDLILAVRSFVSLALSTLGAIGFAVLLVAFLPFKEATSEILSRTQPNTLDLGIALFSGAIGSVAICKEVKGVVTSIPGVAIAVALMPPLCVVGYGIGLAISLSPTEGIKVASGGGLLYLTNLVAITFMAMVVFIMLRIDTPKVREKVAQWRDSDPESVFWQNAISKIPTLEHAREIRSWSLRLLMILLPLLLIFIPLSQSYSRVKMQIQQKQTENQILKTAKKVWNERFAIQPNGQERTLDDIQVKTKNDKVEVYLRVIDNQPYTQDERNDFLEKLSKELNRRKDSLSLQLVEIAASAAQEISASAPQVAETPIPPTIAELQSQYLQSIKNALTGMALPPPAKVLDYQINTNVDSNATFELYYLSERDIDVDARNLLADELKRRLNLPNAEIVFERVPTDAQSFDFAKNQKTLSDDEKKMFDQTGNFLEIHPRLRLEVALKADKDEELTENRRQAIKDYLKQNWFIDENRINFIVNEDEAKPDSTRIFMVEQDK